MIDFCDNPPTFYDERRVKARKVHRCCETGNVILPGQFYWRIFGVWEGDARSYAQCEGAYHFARYISKLDGHGCICFGGVWEYINEVHDDALLTEWHRVKNGEITRPGV